MATKKKSADDKILAMIQEVRKRKGEIAKAMGKPQWKTNCSFTFVSIRGVDPINLHVETDIRVLITIASFLQQKEIGYEVAAAELEIETPPVFEWHGFSVADWIDDVKTRIAKVQVTAKKAKLQDLESRLDKIVSPELRAQLELEAIEKELGE